MARVSPDGQTVMMISNPFTRNRCDAMFAFLNWWNDTMGTPEDKATVAADKYLSLGGDQPSQHPTASDDSLLAAPLAQHSRTISATPGNWFVIAPPEIK